MNNTELEKKIRDAYNNAAPSDIDSILSDIKNRKGNVIVMETTNKKKSWVTKFIAVAAVVALLLTGALVIRNASTQNAVDITVLLDVNPSIEINVNSKEKVLSVVPRNVDAEIIVGEMDFSGNTLEVTMNALIGSMLRHGYITELNNSILISVESSNTARSAEIQKRLAEEVSSILKGSTFNGAVLSQSVDPDSELRELAESYGITVGKAQLIKSIIAYKPAYTFESLVLLSINELNLIANAASELPSITSSGTASDGSYIGVDAAVDIALNHAGASRDDVWQLETELDYEHGIMVYEIEFKYNGYEYDYHINAVSGDIVKYERDRDDDMPPVNPTQPPVTPTTPPVDPSQAPVNPTQPPAVTDAPVTTSAPTQPSYITMEQAKSIAFNHAGVNANDVVNLMVEFDFDDGVPVYEIEFNSGAYEYDYDIHAVSGAVLKHDRELIDDDDDAPPSGQIITRDRALEIALAHAGINPSEIWDLDIELDNDDGMTVYEIEFKWGNYEYEYTVNAITGSILKYSREFDD